MTRRFLIDTDTASDDAVALLMALREPSISVEAITVVAGNVPLDQAVQNALYTAELAGRPEVPIHAGRAAPLMRTLETAQFVHGEDGMGDIGLPLEGREPAGNRAVDVIVDTITGSPGEITLVTLGPLTNIAIALLNEPGIADAVEHCYVMGGACDGGGNVTPLAEFNLWADPEAARVVVQSGMPLTFIGWDISVTSATFGPEAAEELRAIGPLGEFAVDIQAVLDVYAREQSKIAGFDLPDPIAMAVAIDPSIATFEDLHVDVLIGDGPERGQDVVDWHGVTDQEPNVRVTRHVPREAFVSMLERQLTT
jgi:purine nucleosidase